VVVGEQEVGQTYYWHEFNLETDGGESATLVYEMTEHGPEWRWITMFEPARGMTAEEAAAKRAGDHLEIEGVNLRITLVRRSRIYHIEGAAPEGEEVGDLADYFNAESGKELFVVSWTGKEIEFYRGSTIPRSAVVAAFHLRGDAFAGLFLSENAGSSSSSSGLVMKMVFIAFTAVIIFAVCYSCIPPRRPLAVVTRSAPSSSLAIGSTGILNDRAYRIAAHAIVQVAQVGVRFDRHEFQLRDGDGNQALLIQGLTLNSTDWAFLTPFQPALALTPKQAAAVRWGQRLDLDGTIVPVTEVFTSTVLQAENPEPSGSKTGETTFGFAGQNGSTLLLARWTARQITFYRGQPLPAPVVTAAFSVTAAK
jgi:hypothetical protein